MSLKVDKTVGFYSGELKTNKVNSNKNTVKKRQNILNKIEDSNLLIDEKSSFLSIGDINIII